MSEADDRCTVCRSLVDEEDLFCANCGTEAPRPSLRHDARTTATHRFDCQGCGASMSYDASAQTLRCPFCGGDGLAAQADAPTVAPEWVVPFAVDRVQAEQVLRTWLGRGFWRPPDLRESAVVTQMTAVFVPYWVFSAQTLSYWTADTDQTYPGARAAWRPLFGTHRETHEGVLVGASSVLTPQETAALGPFDLSAAVPPDRVDLDNVVYEEFRVLRKYARPLARQGLEARVRAGCQQCVPGRARNLHVNLRIEELSSRPALLPVWIFAYRYRDGLFRFLINGQSGQPTGQAPVSYHNFSKVLAIVLMVVAGLVLLGLLARALS